MSWKQSVKLEPLNELFSDHDVQFVKDDLQGGYVAHFGTITIRRPTLMGCAKAVLTEWFKTSGNDVQ